MLAVHENHRGKLPLFQDGGTGAVALEQKGVIRRGKRYQDHRVRRTSSAYCIQEQPPLSVSWGHAPTRGGGEIYEQGRQEQLSPSAAGQRLGIGGCHSLRRARKFLHKLSARTRPFTAVESPKPGQSRRSTMEVLALQKRPVGAEAPLLGGASIASSYTLPALVGALPRLPLPLKGRKSAVQKEARHAKSAPQ